MTTTERLIELSEANTVTPAPEVGEADTSAKLAQLGDDIERARAERAERERTERAARHRRFMDERRLAKVESEIPKLKAAIQERQPVVDRLEEMFEEQRSKLAAMLNDRDAVPFELVPQYEASRHHLDEIDRALTQALSSGAETILGVAAQQVGDGVTYQEKRVRQPHPLLVELAPEVDDWTHPLNPMVEELEKLTAERDRLCKRLGVTE